MDSSTDATDTGPGNVSPQDSTALLREQPYLTNPIQVDASIAAMAVETLEENGDTDQEPEEDSEGDTKEGSEARTGAANIQKSTNHQIKAAREAGAEYLAAGTKQSPNQIAANTKTDKKSHAAKMEPKKVATTTPCKYCGKLYKYAHSLRKHQEDVCAKKPQPIQSRAHAGEIASRAQKDAAEPTTGVAPAHEQTQERAYGPGRPAQIEGRPTNHDPALIFPDGQVMHLAVLSADLNPMAAFQQASMEDDILRTEHVTLAGRLEAIGRVHEYEQEQRMLQYQYWRRLRVVNTAIEGELDRTQQTWESLTTCWGLGDVFGS